MQITTIDVRAESVESKPSKTRKGDAGVESVFASLFANAKNDAKPVRHSKIGEVEEITPLDQPAVTEKTPEEPANSAIESKAANGTKVETASAPADDAPADTPESVESKATATPGKQGAAVANETAATSKAAASVAAIPVAVAHIENASAERAAVVLPESLPSVSLQESPAPTGHAKAVQRSGKTVAALLKALNADEIVLPEGEAKVSPPSELTAARSVPSDALPVAAERFPKQAGLVLVASSPESGAAPVQAAPDPGPVSAPEPNAVAKAEADAATGAEVETAPESTGKAEVPHATTDATPRTPQLIRHVTEVVSPDGTVRTTHVTEVHRDAGVGQNSVTVTERTTLQALPEQALRGVRYLIGNGEQTMRIRLVPDSLGEVRLEVVTSRGDVSVKLASTNAAVREILQTHAHGLREAISLDGAQTVRVTVTQELPQSSWLSSNGQRSGSHAPGREQPHYGHTPPKHQHFSAGTPRREPIHNGRLNVYA